MNKDARKKQIIEGNVFLYSENDKELINEIRLVLNINSKKLIYYEDAKYYKNVFTSTITEYVITKTIKYDICNLIFKEIVEKGLTVRQAEELIRKVTQAGKISTPTYAPGSGAGDGSCSLARERHTKTGIVLELGNFLE